MIQKEAPSHFAHLGHGSRGGESVCKCSRSLMIQGGNCEHTPNFHPERLDARLTLLRNSFRKHNGIFIQDLPAPLKLHHELTSTMHPFSYRCSRNLPHQRSSPVLVSLLQHQNPKSATHLEEHRIFDSQEAELARTHHNVSSKECASLLAHTHKEAHKIVTCMRS